MQKVEDADIDVDELHRKGKMTFDLLEEGESGKIAAFLVIQVSPETVAVPPHRLKTPFRREK